MTDVQRNELFKAYLIDCLDNINQKSTFKERTTMLNNLSTIHSTTNITKAFQAIRNEINYI